MGWVVRLFDRRDTWLRMVLLDLSGVSYLVFGLDNGRQPTAAQLWLAVVAFVAAVALCRWPVICFLAQAALLGVAMWVLHDTTINQVGSSWALAEVAVWARRPRTIWLCAGLLFALYCVLSIPDSPGSLRSELFGVIVLPVGLPLLLGLVIRTTRELGVQAELRAASESRAARADERGAIARELHDVVAHHVASMVLRVGVARHVIPELDPRVSEVLDDVHGTGTTALADLRRLVEVLRDPGGVRGEAAITAIEPGSLPAALGAAVEVARRTGLTVDADIDEAVGEIDAVRGLAVLRLTQEALTNVAKHAGPTARAYLRISVDDGAVSWEVADDGRAATELPSVGPDAGGSRTGHGLIGMRERVEVLGGRLTAGPAGTGWLVRTVLPRAAA
ncbi:histidine kinase [Actinoplanes sp. KI2]|uniref:sensor histidine kinase n=1 Tax=Actinoplanes sp. KI2 TaxID=2983315 RepID=UPI0021D58460|nr:histidine kinase [Actinoplanes sp. KI2]MCU7726091.1 histidine kinase [Actinoplanes sp. KI2]